MRKTTFTVEELAERALTDEGGGAESLEAQVRGITRDAVWGSHQERCSYRLDFKECSITSCYECATARIMKLIELPF